MNGINWQQFIAGIIMIVMISYYIFVLFKTKDNPKFDYIFSRSSQITFIAFVLGMAILIVRIIVKSIDLTWLLDFGAIITIINAICIAYYRRIKTKN